MKTVALIGNSTLSRKFIEKYQTEFEITSFNRPQYDITDKESCDILIQDCNNYDIVIVTPGVIVEDLWTTYLTNTVGPIYLAHGLYELSTVKRIIVVSSYASAWTSWPGIEKWRLLYNNSKNSTTNFLLSLYHSAKSTCKVTAFDPASFKSALGDVGMEIDDVVDTLHYICTLKDDINIPHLRMNKG